MGRIRRLSLPDPKLDQAMDSAVGSPQKGFDLDIRLREFEINQLTQRNNFFMIFQGVMIAGVVQSGGSAAPLISFLVCLTGMFISLLQIGMAGGAKYWQVRWEASTRTSEAVILLTLVKNGRYATQTFVHDLSLLNDEDRQAIEAWNRQAQPEDRIGHIPDFVRKAVERDIKASNAVKPTSLGGRLRRLLDRPVQKWAILPKWSVSRIPIWVGAVLFLFWCILWLNTFSIKGLTEHIRWEPAAFSFVPLKADPKDNK